MSSTAFLTGTLLGPLTIAGKAQQSTPDLGNLSLDSLASMEIIRPVEKVSARLNQDRMAGAGLVAVQ
jgi:hypothetical protein